METVHKVNDNRVDILKKKIDIVSPSNMDGLLFQTANFKQLLKLAVILHVFKFHDILFSHIEKALGLLRNIAI